jgi:hypothetical protein
MIRISVPLIQRDPQRARLLQGVVDADAHSSGFDRRHPVEFAMTDGSTA